MTKKINRVGEFRIGISGWTYQPWRGTFYPKTVTLKQELAFAATQVNSVEINGSFYSLQRPSSYKKWFAETPENFVFAVKGGRFITHMKRLQNVETPLANFFASGVLCLEQKLGPILWQLPPQFVFRPEVLRAFFDLLPRNTLQAAKLAARHDERLKGRTWIKTTENRPIRHALEVRHPTFVDPAFIQILRQHDIGLVIADTAGKWPFMEDVTSDFIYVRLHGGEELYVSGYGPEALENWAEKIRGWGEGKSPASAKCIAAPPAPAKTRDVFVYFDNDVKVRAPYDAMNLAYKLGIGPKPGKAPNAAAITETARTSWPAVVNRWKLTAPQKKLRNQAAKKAT